MPYSQAPTPCHPALGRAPAVPMQCNTSMLPAPAPVCSKGVRSPAEPASAPRLLAADRRYGHLGPESAWIVANRPSSMPGRVWSSLVFAGRSAFPLNRKASTGCGRPCDRGCGAPVFFNTVAGGSSAVAADELMDRVLAFNQPDQTPSGGVDD